MSGPKPLRAGRTRRPPPFGWSTALFGLAAEVGAGFTPDDAAQQDQANEVRQSHQSVQQVRQIPDEVQAVHGTGISGDHVQQSVERDGPRPEQVPDAPVALVAPANNGREGEQGQADRYNQRPQLAGQSLLERELCERGAVQTRLPRSGSENADRQSPPPARTARSIWRARCAFLLPMRCKIRLAAAGPRPSPGGPWFGASLAPVCLGERVRNSGCERTCSRLGIGERFGRNIGGRRSAKAFPIITSRRRLTGRRASLT